MGGNGVEVPVGVSPWLLHFTYHGRPEVKKNSQKIIRQGWRPKVRPSDRFLAAQDAAVLELKKKRIGRPLLGNKKQHLHVRVHFYLGFNQKPDLDNLISACSDILEKAGIIESDYWVMSWDGSRRFRDRENPRTEVWIGEEIRR